MMEFGFSFYCNNNNFSLLLTIIHSVDVYDLIFRHFLVISVLFYVRSVRLKIKRKKEIHYMNVQKLTVDPLFMRVYLYLCLDWFSHNVLRHETTKSERQQQRQKTTSISLVIQHNYLQFYHTTIKREKQNNEHVRNVIVFTMRKPFCCVIDDNNSDRII